MEPDGGRGGDPTLFRASVVVVLVRVSECEFCGRPFRPMEAWGKRYRSGGPRPIYCGVECADKAKAESDKFNRRMGAK